MNERCYSDDEDDDNSGGGRHDDYYKLGGSAESPSILFRFFRVWFATWKRSRLLFLRLGFGNSTQFKDYDQVVTLCVSFLSLQ